MQGCCEGLPGDASALSLRQLEALMRVHVMMSLLRIKGSRAHKELTHLALALCMQIWKVCLVLARNEDHSIAMDACLGDVCVIKWGWKECVAPSSINHNGVGIVSNTRASNDVIIFPSVTG